VTVSGDLISCPLVGVSTIITPLAEEEVVFLAELVLWGDQVEKSFLTLEGEKWLERE